MFLGYVAAIRLIIDPARMTLKVLSLTWELPMTQNAHGSCLRPYRAVAGEQVS